MHECSRTHARCQSLGLIARVEHPRTGSVLWLRFSSGHGSRSQVNATQGLRRPRRPAAAEYRATVAGSEKRRERSSVSRASSADGDCRGGGGGTGLACGPQALTPHRRKKSLVRGSAATRNSFLCRVCPRRFARARPRQRNGIRLRNLLWSSHCLRCRLDATGLEFFPLSEHNCTFGGAFLFQAVHSLDARHCVFPCVVPIPSERCIGTPVAFLDGFRTNGVPVSHCQSRADIGFPPRLNTLFYVFCLAYSVHRGHHDEGARSRHERC